MTELPLVLQLDQAGNPQGWITFEDSCYYMAKDLVAWSAGETEILLRGGINAVSGKRSTLLMNTIIAVKQQHKINDRRFDIINKVPLTNVTLFRRDKHTCAICGEQFHSDDLSRDHIIPTSRGGPNTWQNCITMCHTHNLEKDDYLLEELGWKLLFVPYVPNKSESLILKNKKILADQMEFLMARVPKESRLLS